jgi:2-dehydropantoate 2-reductase
MKQERVALVGAGAIGGITAILTREAGYDVTIVTKHEDVAKMAREEGLAMEGARGTLRVRMNAVAKPSRLKGSFDIVLLVTKAPDMPEAARAMMPHLKEDSAVVSLQNGLCEEELASIVGMDRTIGCVVGWGATMISPGKYDMTSTGEFTLGTLDNRPHPRFNAVVKCLSSVVETRTSDNMLGSLYSKLIINACITTLGAICGLTLGEMLAMKKARDLFIEVIREAVAVADRAGITIEPYNQLNYYSFVRGDGFFSDLFRHGLIRLMGIKYRRLRSSSLQSLERGKETEVEYFNGYIAKRGEELNVPVPVNRALTDMVHEIEGGERSISVENFDQIQIPS